MNIRERLSELVANAAPRATRSLPDLSTLANLAHVGSSIGLYAGQASLGRLTIRERQRRIDFFTRNIGRWAQRVLDRMNVRVEVSGLDSAIMRERNFLIVSNHLSYLDILVLASIQPSVFVTSVDLGESAFLGPMAEMGGSLFIERRHRRRINEDLTTIAETLKSGHNVVLFPEGTSGDGQQVMSFKKSMLKAAIEARADVLPVVIKYTEIDGERLSAANAEKVCWYGDIGFAPHFLRMMQLKSVRVEVHFLEPIVVEGNTSRHELAERAHSAISRVYDRL